MNSVEIHPFKPFLPFGAKLLMLGTFPPAEKRWSMRFYYPNFQNDMWRIVGLCFFGDREHFVDAEHRCFRLSQLTDFLSERGIALFDTATAVRRTRNTASDKELEVVEPTDVSALLRQLPQCKAVATAGQLATELFCRQMAITAQPKVGQYVEFGFEGRTLRLYRMPSSSRAYPMRLERKAGSYQPLFDFITNEQIANSKTIVT